MFKGTLKSLNFKGFLDISNFKDYIGEVSVSEALNSENIVK